MICWDRRCQARRLRKGEYDQSKQGSQQGPCASCTFDFILPLGSLKSGFASEIWWFKIFGILVMHPMKGHENKGPEHSVYQNFSWNNKMWDQQTQPQQMQPATGKKPAVLVCTKASLCRTPCQQDKSYNFFWACSIWTTKTRCGSVCQGPAGACSNHGLDVFWVAWI